ncbi:MAG: hypothetical protein QF752_13280 [Planctomycetota bacterium]|jgi:hypothetical protein|nr:hypothetical protein [Planctomycetota bacterium]
MMKKRFYSFRSLGILLLIGVLPLSEARAQKLKECSAKKPVVLEDDGSWEKNSNIISSLIRKRGISKSSLSNVLKDLNRKGKRIWWIDRTRPRTAFRWNWGDFVTKKWMPQGISSSMEGWSRGTVSGKKVLLVSWYSKTNTSTESAQRGCRISVIDISNPNKIRYRHILLVVPKGSDSQPNFGPAVRKTGGLYAPLKGGGIAWYGNYLYVPEYRNGFRVFDLRLIMKVSTYNSHRCGRRGNSSSAFGYKYILPQVAHYRLLEGGGLFNFASIDRSTRPHSILSGDYIYPGNEGRIYRWSLNGRTCKLSDTKSTQVYSTRLKGMQGSISNDRVFWTNCSGFWPRIYRQTVAGSTRAYRWPIGPEDLSYDVKRGDIWALKEFAWNRYVWSVRP